MLTAALAGFGRTISEVGAILVVGGNIAGYTRTMTTTIALETSKGNLSLALGLGLVLIGISMAVSATAFALGSGRTAVMMARQLVALLLAGWLATVAGAARARSIVLASTTSVQDSGLLEHILPAFTSATGIEVRVLAQGTGQALATAARGDADLVLVHDPEAEERSSPKGHGTDRAAGRLERFRDRRARAAIPRISAAGTTRGLRSRRSPPPVRHSSRAATRAARMRWKNACGAPSASSRPAPMAMHGTATSAAAWGRRSMPPPA